MSYTDSGSKTSRQCEPYTGFIGGTPAQKEATVFNSLLSSRPAPES